MGKPQSDRRDPPEDLDRFWPVSPDVGIEVKSHTDTVAKVEMYRERGSKYAVAVDPDTRDVQERGTPPDGLVLDFAAIIDA